MLKEFDPVVLRTDLEREHLVAGDVGTVVHVYGKGEVYEVEFRTLAGNTVAVTRLEASQIRPAGPREVPHARTLVKA